MSNFPQKPDSLTKCVGVCQNRTCKKQGAKSVLNAFQTVRISNVTVTASGCLGRCSNGPIVLFLPDIVWFSKVQPQEVPWLIRKYLSW